jgi:signal transduction histidine kinase/CheY-like chemotaxis protein
MGAVSHSQVRQIGEMNQRDIRSRSARRMAAVLMLASLFWWWALLSEVRPSLAPTVLSALLMPALFATYYLAERRIEVATWVLLVACLAGALLAPPYLPPAAVVPLLILPGVAAAGVIGPVPGLALTAFVLLVSASGLPEPRALIAGEALMLYLVVVAIVSPRDSVLDWSWHRSAEAIHLAEQLRDRQGELNKALSALHVAYQLLERSNRELAVAHQEAEEARRLKEEFAANVSHELRTPLNIILGFAEIMHRAPATYGAVEWPPVLRRDVAEIWMSAHYISELVDDILELARVDALRMPVKREIADLAAVVKETVQLAERLTDGKAVKLELDLDPALPPVFLDRTRIRQVLLNLLTNAIRFTDAGTVTISAVRREQDVLVTVADTGVGIPPHELESVFREFHRSEGPGQRGGKGLGLAIARRFVQLHGGTIWAESRLGVGSKFHFTLPLQEKWVSRLAGKLSASVPGEHTVPVLVASIAGDDRAWTFIARHLDGFDTLAADSLEAVPAMLERHHPAAVLIEGPVPQVIEKAEELSDSLPPGIPVIATSLPLPSAVGADGCFSAMIGKPVTRERLLQVLRTFVESGSVLVVDDDRGFVQLIRRMLAASGEHYQVRWAYDGQEALEKLAAAPVDVVLVDVMMEPMSGLTLAQTIRRDERLGAIPIIAVTGATALHDEARISWVQLSKRGGMKDAEALAVLRSLLTAARAEYVSIGPSDEGPTAAGPGRPVSAGAPWLPGLQPGGDPGTLSTLLPGSPPSLREP